MLLLRISLSSCWKHDALFLGIGVLNSCPTIRARQPPTPRLSCSEKFDWNDGRVSPRNKSSRCHLNSSTVRVGQNRMDMTPPPFIVAEDTRAHFHRKVVRHHVHRFMVIGVVLEDESYDRCFVILNVTISRFVPETTEFHLLIPIQRSRCGRSPKNGRVHHKKRQSMPVQLSRFSWSISTSLS